MNEWNELKSDEKKKKISNNQIHTNKYTDVSHHNSGSHILRVRRFEMDALDDFRPL